MKVPLNNANYHQQSQSQPKPDNLSIHVAEIGELNCISVRRCHSPLVCQLTIPFDEVKVDISQFRIVGYLEISVREDAAISGVTPQYVVWQRNIVYWRSNKGYGFFVKSYLDNFCTTSTQQVCLKNPGFFALQMIQTRWQILSLDKQCAEERTIDGK